MILLALLWTCYFSLHSALASLRVKTWMKSELPQPFKYYRLFYNVFALASIIMVILFQASLSSQPIATLPVWVPVTGYVLIGAGMSIIGLTFKNYDTREFVGIAPMNEFNRTNARLITTGLNAYVRHPIYSGISVALIGYLLVSFDYRTLIFFTITIIYIIVGAWLEEQKLIVLYRDAYIEYKKRVNMLIPFI